MIVNVWNNENKMNASKNNKSFVPARNIDLHFDTRDMVPFYSKLVDGIYTRPIVVTFLFPRKYCRKINVASPSSNERKEPLMARSSSPNFNESVLYEPSVSAPGSPITADRPKPHDGEDDDVLSVDFHQQKVREVIKHARISKHFVITVTDVVESRDASYKVIVRDYKDLLKEIKAEYQGSNAVQDYFNPQSIRWWIAYIDQVLLVFDRPSGKLGVLVDKGKIAYRVKRKMEHHQWMIDQLNASSVSFENSDFKQKKENFHGSVLDENAKFSSAMEDLLVHFEQLPDESHKEKKEELEEHLANEKNDPLEDSIDDFAIVGKDAPQPRISNVDSLEAQEVHEEDHEIDILASSVPSQPAGSITANILDDLSITASDKTPSEHEQSQQQQRETITESSADKNHANKTPKKRKICSAENNNGQSSKINNNSNISPPSATSTKFKSNSNHEPIKKQPPRQSRSSLLGPSITSNDNQSLRNSTSLPVISHSDGHYHNNSNGQSSKHPLAQHNKSQVSAVITPQQGRTNKLLEDAYGVAATSILFPASYAREEERLRQSLVVSLPGNKMKKRASSAAGGSNNDNHALSRSHDGRLPSITQPSLSFSPIKRKSKDKLASIFDQSTEAENSSKDRLDEGMSMDLSEIVHQVAKQVGHEIEEMEASGNNEKFSPIEGEESFRFMNNSSPHSDSQYDPYRHLAVSSAFVSVERCMSPQPRPGSPFAEELKHLKGSKKLAAEIIHKARKSVSGNAKFQVRKISFSEKKLLDSPFAKKLWIDPVDDASRILVLDGGSSIASAGSPLETSLNPPLSNDLLPVEDDTALSLHAASTTSLPVIQKKQHSSPRRNHHSSTKRPPTTSRGHSAVKTSTHSNKRMNRGSTAPTVDHLHATHTLSKYEKCQDQEMTNVLIVDNEQEITISEDVRESTENEQVATTVTVANSRKIVYLDTDDSVTVEEKLNLTISHLVPEVPPASDANTLAQEEVLKEEQCLFAEQVQEQVLEQERTIELEVTSFKVLETSNNNFLGNQMIQEELIGIDYNNCNNVAEESNSDSRQNTNEDQVQYHTNGNYESEQQERAAGIQEVTAEPNYGQTDVVYSDAVNSGDYEANTDHDTNVNVDANYQYNYNEGGNTSCEVNCDNANATYESNNNEYYDTKIHNYNNDVPGDVSNAYYSQSEKTYSENPQVQTQEQQ